MLTGIAEPGSPCKKGIPYQHNDFAANCQPDLMHSSTGRKWQVGLPPHYNPRWKTFGFNLSAAGN